MWFQSNRKNINDAHSDVVSAAVLPPTRFRRSLAFAGLWFHRLVYFLGLVFLVALLLSFLAIQYNNSHTGASMGTVRGSSTLLPPPFLGNNEQPSRGFSLGIKQRQALSLFMQLNSGVLLPGLKGEFGSALPLAPTLMVFADPNCPNCRALESNLVAAAAEGLAKIYIFPIATRDGSMEQGAAMMCGALGHSSSPAIWSSEIWAGWQKIMSGSTLPISKACDEGSKVIKANTNLFHALEFSQTPTLVLSDGRLAVGALDAETLHQFLQGSVR